VSPGGVASPFCEPAKTKSSPQASVSTGAPASEETASTSSSAADSSRTTRAISASGLTTPVEVSLCATVTAS
jgi:hypothetical protein